MRVRMGWLVAVAVAAALMSPAAAPADFLVGPGNVLADGNDTDFDLIAVDFTRVAFEVPPGTYTATQFNYQFSTPDLTTLGGSVTPFLATGGIGDPNFFVVAVGNPVVFDGVTEFVSTPFGGQNTFTLAATANVYAGFFWDGSAAGESGGGGACPIGYLSPANTAFVRSGGANAPVVGTNISGGTAAVVRGRDYDFSITFVGPTAAVPEPASVGLAAVGAAGLLAARRRSRRA